MNKKENIDFYSREQTLAISGIFAIFVFLHHLPGYWDTYQTIFFKPVLYVREYLGYGVNVPFLFFSGYGIMTQILKNDEYVNKIPVKRILITIINLDIAVLLFMLVNIIFGIDYPLSDVLLSFVAISGIGNSYAYILTMCIMWALTYIACKITRNKNIRCVLIVLFSICYILLSKRIVLYYITIILSYPLGIIVGCYKEEVQKLFKNKLSLFILIIVLFIFVYMKKTGLYIFNQESLLFNVYAIYIICVVLWILSNFYIANPVLCFLGKNMFSIYMMQRLVGTILVNVNTFGLSVDIVMIIDLALTIIVSESFRRLISHIDKAILSKIEKNH